MHTTLKKILARLNNPVTTPVSNAGLGELEDNALDVNVTNDNLDVTVTNHSLDAFARLRVSNPVTELEAKHVLNYASTWADATSGNASMTYDTGNSRGVLNIAPNGVSQDLVYHHTRKTGYYQAGKSQLLLATFAIAQRPEQPAQASDATFEIGMGDITNGLFFGGNMGFLDSTDNVWFERRGFGGSSIATRTNWNVDKLDGTGPSGKTLDLDAAPQIFYADVEWLGVGAIRCGFVIDGEFCHCHTFTYANVPGGTRPYSAAMNLPLRYAVEAQPNVDWQGEEFTLDAICGAVISEGGFDRIGTPYAVRRVAALNANAASIFPLVGWRLNTATSNHRYAVVELESVTAASDQSLFEVLIYLNPTLTGTAAVWTSDNVLQYANAVTNATTVTGGTLLMSAFVGGTQQASSIAAEIRRNFRLSTSISGVDELWLCIRRLGTTGNFYGSANLSIQA